jgi:hypothetical protein
LKDIEDETVSLDCGDTLRSVKCICGQRPTQFRKTVYDDDNDYNDYDDPRAQGLWTIEAAIDRSSANDPLSLSN